MVLLLIKNRVITLFFLFNISDFMDKYVIGKLGEKIATNFLISNGFRLILANFRVRGGEIDLIMEKGRKTVFFEVKTRTFNGFGRPEEAFNYRKQQRFKTAIFSYLAKNKAFGWQGDLLAIELNLALKKAKIRHYKNVLAG